MTYQIFEFYPELPFRVITLMTPAVDLVAGGTIDKISITDYNEIRYGLKKTSSGKIRVEKAKTNKEALE